LNRSRCIVKLDRDAKVWRPVLNEHAPSKYHGRQRLGLLTDPMRSTFGIALAAVWSGSEPASTRTCGLCLPGRSQATTSRNVALPLRSTASRIGACYPLHW